MERKRAGSSPRRARTWKEFDCPECTANNPWDDGFTYGSELFCSWCGAVLLVKQVRTEDHEERYRLVRD